MQITVEDFFLKPNCKTSVSRRFCCLSKIIMSTIFQSKLLIAICLLSHLLPLLFLGIDTHVDNNKLSDATP